MSRIEGGSADVIVACQFLQQGEKRRLCSKLYLQNWFCL